MQGQLEEDLRLCVMLNTLRGWHMKKQINITTPLKPHWFIQLVDGIKHCSVHWLTHVKI